MKNKKRYFANGALIIIVFASFVFYAFSGGITGTTPKNGNGCDCHSPSPTTQVLVVISGPDILQTNQTANYTVTVSGGPLSAAGVNIAASSGTLAPGPGLRLAGDELTQTSPLSPTGGVVTFNFTYTAVTEGQVTLFASGNSVNGNGVNTGDQWNFAANKVITVSGPTGVEDEGLIRTFALGQNYPNPFNPSTTINYEIPDDASGSLVTLKIYDLLGSEIAELVNETKSSGTYQVSFDASSLTSGVYLYHLKAGTYSAVKKMSLMK
jgi:hypothetical protein